MTPTSNYRLSLKLTAWFCHISAFSRYILNLIKHVVKWFKWWVEKHNSNITFQQFSRRLMKWNVKLDLFRFAPFAACDWTKASSSTLKYILAGFSSARGCLPPWSEIIFHCFSALKVSVLCPCARLQKYLLFPSVIKETFYVFNF